MLLLLLLLRGRRGRMSARQRSAARQLVNKKMKKGGAIYLETPPGRAPRWPRRAVPALLRARLRPRAQWAWAALSACSGARLRICGQQLVAGQPSLGSKRTGPFNGDVCRVVVSFIGVGQDQPLRGRASFALKKINACYKGSSSSPSSPTH